MDERGRERGCERGGRWGGERENACVCQRDKAREIERERKEVSESERCRGGRGVDLQQTKRLTWTQGVH